jgi:hypothetical protein
MTPGASGGMVLNTRFVANRKTAALSKSDSGFGPGHFLRKGMRVFRKLSFIDTLRPHRWRHWDPQAS